MEKKEPGTKKRTPVPADPVRIRDEVVGLFTTAEEGPETEQELKLRSRLNLLVHRTLVAGLILSAAMLFAGLAMSAFRQQPVPHTVSGFVESLRGLPAARPESFLSLGILMLIGTPVLRILGSLAEFISNRDWLYTCVTFLVLVFLAAGLFTGRG